MNKIVTIQIPYYAINDEQCIKRQLQLETGLNNLYFRIIKKSIDARSKIVKFTLKVLVTDVPTVIQEKNAFFPVFKKIGKSSPTVHIIGAGPAGLFAALKCLELGIKPIIFEQGKTVRDRRRDLANITKKGIVNPTSNYCFGEGGAGTYSDGKLYTRSNKRGDIDYVLNYLVYFGASPEILVEAHPHIGTNKLPHIIENIRDTIIKNGGEIHFQHKVIDINFSQDEIKSIIVKDIVKDTIIEVSCKYLVLAVGHSARYIYNLLFSKKIHIEFKAFAFGVRVEHPQELIDKIQYHCKDIAELNNMRQYLPAARYSLIDTNEKYSVYSFCMCPGGIIAPCATDFGEVVTNGWSPSKRNNPFANSGIVVAIDEKVIPDAKNNPLAGMHYQRKFERLCFELGGRNLFAPAQRLTDFIRNKESINLPDCSYRPGVVSVNLRECLPEYVYNSLKDAFIHFDKKMKGYVTQDAIVVAPESRTSSPVRIVRDAKKYHHLQISNLYPCGEGAGYAGGIMSAAIDGINVVQALYNQM